ncbi:endo-1,4-beta-xylanase (glycosyl hydrolase family 10) [Actinacidiphila yanglinensis]|uniref:Beta-xylanase n=1 Tax=Actinacidiphila yanglinensis TaxID=310779 RepID=A0A1H5SA49_9ACTN|nr:endo-1,4-beta-xylanase [Actinacidiphila yanglinensis]SEF46868.1 endo-1,4-beta-xylanase (glycosyl hydrolase family 10) [Actinacidiphila yanglinensis]
MFSKRTLRSAVGGSGVALLAVTAALVAVAMPSAHAADTPLRTLAEAKGIYMGTALMANELTGTSASIASTQFDEVTPGNEMKWDTVEPTQGTYNWGPGDQIVSFAQQHGMQVRGHNLVWHSQLPNWLTSGSFTNTQVHDLMIKHVTDEVTHYKGKVIHWDVVNEPFNEDGTYRSDIWYNQIGQSYIADALTAAHAADPAAKLYINDYNIEGENAKSNAMYNLVKSLKQQGVPIDGVGFQAHFILGQIPSDFEANLQRFADLGVDVAVTELDVRMNTPATAANLQQQASDYTKVVDDCLGVSRCQGITVWGFNDATSWVPSTFPGQGAATPYDENYQPKPAYYAIQTALGGSGSTTPPTSPPTTPPGGGGACTVGYATNEWSTGVTANITVTSASAVNGWTVVLTYPGGSRTVTQAWNATVTQNGSTLTAKNLSYNGTLAAGGSATFGFNANWSGSDPKPSGATLNGTACTVS